MKCKKCLLDEKVPGSNIDETGICRPCREFSDETVIRSEEQRKKFEQDLEKTLSNCRGKGEYDVLVSFSGGKDSIYLLNKIVNEYKLRTLAYTSNFDQPDVALDNIKRTIEKLGVDHVVYSPSTRVYKKFIRHLLKNQNEKGAVHTVCYFWLDMREGDMLKLAVEKNIPVILTGYAPGQPEEGRMLYEMPQKRIHEDWTPYGLIDQGVFDKDDVKRFWNPTVYPKGTIFPRFLAPFHAWEYDQYKVIEKVVELGLVKNKLHASPVFSNFTLNWLFMYLDLNNFGYNPYLPEFAELIRQGKAKYSQWRVIFPVVDWMIKRKILLGKNVKKGLKWLELEEHEL